MLSFLLLPRPLAIAFIITKKVIKLALIGGIIYLLVNKRRRKSISDILGL